MWISARKITDLAVPRQFVMTTITADDASVSCSAVPTIIAHPTSIVPLAVITDQAPSATTADQTPTVLLRLTRPHDGILSFSSGGGKWENERAFCKSLYRIHFLEVERVSG